MSENIYIESESDNEDDEKEQYFVDLMEAYEQIPDKRNLNKDERNLRKEIMNFLYHEKKMRDEEIGGVLQVPQSQVGTWRRGENLPTNKKNKMVKERKTPVQEKVDYYRSPEEVERVVRFILIAKSVIKDNSEDSKEKSISLRKILDPKS